MIRTQCLLSTCRADKSLQSLAEIRDCCHMLLVCQIMSKSRSGPEVNHGCASFPIHTHKHLQTNQSAQDTVDIEHIYFTFCTQQKVKKECIYWVILNIYTIVHLHTNRIYCHSKQMPVTYTVYNVHSYLQCQKLTGVIYWKGGEVMHTHTHLHKHTPRGKYHDSATSHTTMTHTE